jgi:hypothetical protein
MIIWIMLVAINFNIDPTYLGEERFQNRGKYSLENNLTLSAGMFMNDLLEDNSTHHCDD